MVSIKEIARYCGVSTATVSKAMNDKSDIGEETKRRIREAAERLGYFPNATARALRTKRSHSIGVLFSGKNGKVLTDEFFSHVVNAFKVAVEKRGYEILFLNKEVGDHGMTYLEHCRYRGVDGVLVAYVQYQDPEVVELLRSDIPMVLLDHIFQGKTSVCFDYNQGIKDLVTYIYNMGHRKIAYIHGEQCTITQDISVAGYDGIPLAKAFSPELTTLEQDSARMGEMLANKLIDQIECDGSIPAEQLMVQGKVLPGKSVRKLEK